MDELQSVKCDFGFEEMSSVVGGGVLVLAIGKDGGMLIDWTNSVVALMHERDSPSLVTWLTAWLIAP